MKEVEKHTPSDIAGMIFWGHTASREVIDSNGRKLGIVRGFLVDKNWMISQLVIEVKKEILDEVGFEQKHKVLNVALVNLPSSYVDVASDVVRLNTAFNSLRGKVHLYEVRK
jgi:hypothetical protein